MQRRLCLLWVTPHLPRRGVSAARAHWWSLLAELSRRHDITLLAFVDPDDVGAEHVLPSGLAAVHQIPKAPWYPDDPLAMLPRTVLGGFTHPALATAVAAQLAMRRYDLVQYEFTEMAYLMPPPVVPTILTVHQIGFAGERPMWQAQRGNLLRGAVLVHRYLRELDFELRAVRRAHHVVTVSPEDAARLRRFYPDLRVSVSPVGVDCAYFRPPTEIPHPGVDLVFLGHFGHSPNPDAAQFLVREVLPRLGRAVRLRIIGQGVTPEVAALAAPEFIEVTGPVPDVRPCLAAAKVVVAPVRFGTGMRGKVLEALAMARPVVTTSVGAEGLGAVSGRHLLIADGAEEFAASVRRLLDDSDFARNVGAGGRVLVETRFNWPTIAAGHDEIYEKVLNDPGPAPVWSRDLAPSWAPAAARFGRWPAIAAGAGVLLLRAVGWHLARLRRQSSLWAARQLAGTRGKTA